MAANAACDHEWRIARTWESEKYHSNADAFKGTAIVKSRVEVTTYDEWYCVRCRVIETVARG